MKRGRPAKPLAEKKNWRLDLRVTEAEKTAFKRAADNENRELSVWIRIQLHKAAGGVLQHEVGKVDDAKHGKANADRNRRLRRDLSRA